MFIRRTVSHFLNNLLNRFGYAIVRFHGGDENSARFESSAENTYAYENIILVDTLSPWATDQEFQILRKLIIRNTLVDVYRCYELYQMVKEVSGIDGDILEVGVWRGGTGAILAAAAKRWKPEANVFLCDTFSGVVKADEHDPGYRGGEHSDTSEEIVSSLISKIDGKNIKILSGIFPEETSESIGQRNISLCHIDVDVYKSALDVVRWVEPRMLSGACIVFDDYGFSSCQGITRVVDELRATGRWIYIYNLNKHAILIKR